MIYFYWANARFFPFSSKTCCIVPTSNLAIFRGEKIKFITFGNIEHALVILKEQTKFHLHIYNKSTLTSLAALLIEDFSNFSYCCLHTVVCAYHYANEAGLILKLESQAFFYNSHGSDYRDGFPKQNILFFPNLTKKNPNQKHLWKIVYQRNHESVVKPQNKLQLSYNRQAPTNPLPNRSREIINRPFQCVHIVSAHTVIC